MGVASLPSCLGMCQSDLSALADGALEAALHALAHVVRLQHVDDAERRDPPAMAMAGRLGRYDGPAHAAVVLLEERARALATQVQSKEAWVRAGLAASNGASPHHHHPV